MRTFLSHCILLCLVCHPFFSLLHAQAVFWLILGIPRIVFSQSSGASSSSAVRGIQADMSIFERFLFFFVKTRYCHTEHSWALLLMWNRPAGGSVDVMAEERLASPQNTSQANPVWQGGGVENADRRADQTLALDKQPALHTQISTSSVPNRQRFR